MKLKTYKDWGIFAKIMSLSVLTWLVLALATMFVLAPFTAAEEQTAKTREISSNVMNLNDLAQQNDHALHETAVAADDVSRQAEELKQLVGQFRL